MGKYNRIRKEEIRRRELLHPKPEREKVDKPIKFLNQNGEEKLIGGNIKPDGTGTPK